MEKRGYGQKILNTTIDNNSFQVRQRQILHLLQVSASRVVSLSGGNILQHRVPISAFLHQSLRTHTG